MVAMLISLIISIYSTDPKPKPTLAVLTFSNSAMDSNSVNYLTDALTDELMKINEFRMVERDQINQILAEQAFEESGACDQSECAIKIGKLLSVNYVVLGSARNIDNGYAISARIVKVGSGEIISSSRIIIPTINASSIAEKLPILARELSKTHDATSDEIYPSWRKYQFYACTSIPSYPLYASESDKFDVDIGASKNIIDFNNALMLSAGLDIDYIHIYYDFVHEGHLYHSNAINKIFISSNFKLNYMFHSIYASASVNLGLSATDFPFSQYDKLLRYYLGSGVILSNDVALEIGRIGGIKPIETSNGVNGNVVNVELDPSFWLIMFKFGI